MLAILHTKQMDLKVVAPNSETTCISVENTYIFFELNSLNF